LRKGERDLFIFPSKDAQELAEKSVKRQQGYNLIHWEKSGMEYWAISDLNEAELRQFAEIIQNRLSPSPWN
jgi:anti-sigma factor RsiW